MATRARRHQEPAAARPTGDRLGLDGIGFLLGTAHRARRRLWEAQLADLGLSAPQAAILRLITAEPGCGIRELARRIGTDPMNARRIVESLLEGGLCESRPDPDDARRRPLYPTPRGRVLAQAVADRARRDEQNLLSALGEDGYESLVAALRTLIAHQENPQGAS
ncbi:MAG: MarR family winged helix-turn-helix transcriptional regulator [Actinomycetota bacterium]|nr:MarR family winged helix-turn-helix transcriptional regulator [Actinomycetota bacterium]